MFAEGLDARRLVTMASIVEKEAKAPEERPLIAGVFYNRLRLGMPLQSDPTAQYDLDGDQESAEDAVHTESAFNTYDFTGLPPGPIANPGLKSIQAALNPTPTDYLYFVAREGGTHVFSKSYDEHRHAIALERKPPAGKPAARADKISWFGPPFGRSHLGRVRYNFILWQIRSRLSVARARESRGWRRSA